MHQTVYQYKSLLNLLCALLDSVRAIKTSLITWNQPIATTRKYKNTRWNNNCKWHKSARSLELSTQCEGRKECIARVVSEQVNGQVNGPWAGTGEAMAASRGRNIINEPKQHADKCTQSEFIPLFFNPRPCKQKFAKGFIIKVKKNKFFHI